MKIDSLKFYWKKLSKDYDPNNPKSNVVSLPCGRCIECRKSYIDGWIYRINNEFKASTTRSAYFCTYTYSDDYLYDPNNGLVTPDGELTLNYKHHQLFMKRLRKSYEKTSHSINYRIFLIMQNRSSILLFSNSFSIFVIIQNNYDSSELYFSTNDLIFSN